MALRPGDFKSHASTSFATRAGARPLAVPRASTKTVSTAALNPVTAGDGRVFVSTNAYFGVQDAKSLDARTGADLTPSAAWLARRSLADRKRLGRERPVAHEVLVLREYPELAERVGRRPRDAFGQGEEPVLFALAEVLRPEQFLQTNDLRSPGSGLAHAFNGFGKIVLRVGGTRHLHQSNINFFAHGSIITVEQK